MSIDAIKRDAHWLGFDWGERLFHASDYFEQLYEWAEHLIRNGKAYVDDQSRAEMRASRGDRPIYGSRPGKSSMNDMKVTIRRLEAADAERFRDIRLEGLRHAPEAFGSSFEDESAHDLSWFAERLQGSHVLGAFDGSKLLGVAGFLVQRGRKSAHKGLLVGMYVRPAVQGRGVGRALVEAILDVARERVELIQLTVERNNRAARRLYTNLGFQDYGLEKDALKVGDRYLDEILMALDLRPG